MNTPEENGSTEDRVQAILDLAHKLGGQYLVLDSFRRAAYFGWVKDEAEYKAQYIETKAAFLKALEDYRKSL